MAEESINIEQVVESLKTLTNSHAKIVGVVKSVIEKVGDGDVDKKKLKTFKVVNDVVSNYMEIVASTLSALSQAAPDGDIKKLLGATDIAEKEVIKDAEGKEHTEWHVKETKFAVVDSLIQLTQVFSNLNKVIESIAKTDYGNFAQAKMNMILFNSNIQDLLSVLTKTLADMSNSINSEDIKKLMGQETTEKFSEYTAEKSDFFSDKGLKGEKMEAVLKSQSEKTVKEYGLLDVMDRFFTVLSVISSFKAPSLLKTYIEIQKSEIVMKMIIDEFSNLLVYAESNGLTKDRVDEFGHTIETISNVFGDSQMGIVYTLKQISKDLNPVATFFIKFSLDALYHKEKGAKKAEGFIPEIANMLNSKEIKSIAENSKEDGPLMKANQAIGQLVTLAESIKVLGNPLIIVMVWIAKASLLAIKGFISAAVKFLEWANELDIKDSRDKLSTITEALGDIKSIIDSLNSIAKSAILMTVLAIPATIGLIAGLLIVLTLTVFIKVLNKTLAVALGDKEYAKMKEQLLNLRSILLSIVIIEATLILVGLLAPAVVKNAHWILGAILIVGAVVIIIRGILWVIQKMGMNMQKALVSMLIIAAIVGLMTVIMLALVTLSYLPQLINWKGLLIGLGLFVGTLAVIIGIGVLFVAWNGILLACVVATTIATLSILAIVTSINLIALGLLLFSRLNLSTILRKDKDGNIILANNMKAIAESMIIVSNEIWRAYREGNGIIKMAIVTIWLLTSLFTIGALVLIAGALWIFYKIAGSLDEQAVAQAVDKVINLGHYITEIALGEKGRYKEDGSRQEASEEDKGFIDKLISIGGGALEIVKTLLAFVNLAAIALSIAVLWGMAAMLKKIPEIANQLDEKTMVDSVNKIINCANTVHRSVLSGGNATTTAEKEAEDKKKGVWGKVGDFIKGGFNAVSGAIGNLTSAGVLATALISVSEVEGLAAMLSKIQETNIDENDIVNKVNQIIRVSNTVSSNVADQKGVPSAISEEKVKLFGVYVDDSVKLMKQINKLDTDKLVKYSDMWAKMTEFMSEIKNLNIEELSDAIVHKIAPAMSDISDNVGKMSSSDTQTASLAQPNPPAPQSNATSDPTANNVTNAPEPIDYTSILQGIKEAVEDLLQQRMMG